MRYAAIVVTLSAVALAACQPRENMAEEHLRRGRETNPAGFTEPAGNAWRTDNPGGEFRYRGYRIGDPLPKGARVWDDISGAQVIDDPTAYVANPPIGRSHHKIGPEWVDAAELIVLDGRIVGFRVTGSDRVMAAIGEMLKVKYGEPDDGDILEGQTELGATEPIFVHVWRTPHGPMILRYPYPLVNSGWLEMISDDAKTELAKREAARVKQQAKGAF
jgi:hypothetical protein